jgi:hypothetical protein
MNYALTMHSPPSRSPQLTEHPATDGNWVGQFDEIRACFISKAGRK